MVTFLLGAVVGAVVVVVVPPVFTWVSGLVNKVKSKV
jgi:hypothetical protein